MDPQQYLWEIENIRRKECGWKSSVPVAEQKIPVYDATKDQFCSIAESRNFRSAQRKLRKKQGVGRTLLKQLASGVKGKQRLTDPPAVTHRGITALGTSHSSAHAFSLPDFRVEMVGRDREQARRVGSAQNDFGSRRLCEAIERNWRAANVWRSDCASRSW